jgi:glycine dehydrogenase subunit 1
MFIPHTEADREAMLRTIGVKHLEDLFVDIPSEFRYPELDLPPAASEMEVMAEMQEFAMANESTRDLICFLGAGAYNHYSPAVVDSIIRRGEFFTAYTPYQPEISQGTLQAIFEYQSLIAGLTGMDVSNASHYDGATAVAEAVNMAQAVFRGKRNKIVLSHALHPQYRQTVRTYAQDSGLKIVGDESDHGSVQGMLNQSPETLLALIDSQTALVVVQYPDFFGRIFDYTDLAKVVHAAGALLAVSVNPLALGLLKPPGEFGADIVTGEGQPLGIPLSFGGPYLGLFATRNEYVRKMAGRLIGETVDNRGQRAFVLTLTAREQHIRRDKATSNICTNQGLIALASAVYLSALGKQGLRHVAELNYHKAHYAAQLIATLPDYQLGYESPFFNEFVVRCPQPASIVNEILLDHGILGGYDLGRDYPGLENYMLLAVTEMNTREEIDFLADILEEASTDGDAGHHHSSEVDHA